MKHAFSALGILLFSSACIKKTMSETKDSKDYVQINCSVPSTQQCNYETDSKLCFYQISVLKEGSTLKLFQTYSELKEDLSYVETEFLPSPIFNADKIQLNYVTSKKDAHPFFPYSNGSVTLEKNKDGKFFGKISLQLKENEHVYALECN